MKRLLLTIAWCLLNSSLYAQESQWSVVLAAVGSDEANVKWTAILLDKVRAQIETSKLITVRDPLLRGLRSDLTDAEILGRAKELGTTAAVVLQFQASGTRSSTPGYAYLGVIPTIGKPPRYYIQYIVDVTGELLEDAKQLAAPIISTVSGGTYHLIELTCLLPDRPNHTLLSATRPPFSLTSLVAKPTRGLSGGSGRAVRAALNLGYTSCQTTKTTCRSLQSRRPGQNHSGFP